MSAELQRANIPDARSLASPCGQVSRTLAIPANPRTASQQEAFGKR